MELLNNIGRSVAVTLHSRLPLSLKREEGQGLVEYALIISLIAVALVVSLGLLSGKIEDVFTEIGSSLPG